MENRVFLAGKVERFDGTEFLMSNKNLKIKIFINNELKDYINKVAQRFSDGDELYVVVHGFLATLPEYTYVFPYNVVFSKEPQKEANNVVFSGNVSDVYEYENRYRLFIHSKRKDKITKMFVTLFREDAELLNIDPNDLVGKHVAVIGRLSSGKNDDVSIVMSEIFISAEPGTIKSTQSNQKTMEEMLEEDDSLLW